MPRHSAPIASRAPKVDAIGTRQPAYRRTHTRSAETLADLAHDACLSARVWVWFGVQKGWFSALHVPRHLVRARSNLQRSRTSHPVLPVPYVREQGDNQPPQPTYHDRMLASLGSLCVVLGA